MSCLLLGGTQLSQASTTAFGKQFFAAILRDSNANASRLVRFRANQLAVCRVNGQFHMQPPTLRALGMATTNVLVHFVDAFDDNLAVVDIDGKNGSASALVIASDDLNCITFADFHCRNLFHQRSLRPTMNTLTG